jgi:hypothetical protein
MNSFFLPILLRFLEPVMIGSNVVFDESIGAYRLEKSSSSSSSTSLSSPSSSQSTRLTFSPSSSPLHSSYAPSSSYSAHQHAGSDYHISSILAPFGSLRGARTEFDGEKAVPLPQKSRSVSLSSSPAAFRALSSSRNTLKTALSRVDGMSMHAHHPQ